MGSILKDLLGKNKAGGTSSPMAMILPYRNAILMFFLAIGMLVGYIKMYYTPTQLDNAKKTEEIKRLEDLKNKTVDLSSKISGIKKTLSESKELYLESLSHFGNSEDLGELYQSISILAAKYALTVLNIKEIPKPVVQVKTAPGEAPPPQPVTEVKEIIVQVEIKGPYSQYILFKEDLAVAEMLLKVNEETIAVKADGEGSVYATLNLSTYAIDKKPFQNIVGTTPAVAPAAGSTPTTEPNKKEDTTHAQ